MSGEALIFIAEYINILLISMLTIIVTTRNTYNGELILKTSILSIIFI